MTYALPSCFRIAVCLLGVLGSEIDYNSPASTSYAPDLGSIDRPTPRSEVVREQGGNGARGHGRAPPEPHPLPE